MSPATVSAIAATASFVLGCTAFEDRPPRVGDSTVTSAEVGSASNDEAIMRIASARCERALACNAIGEGRAYDDQPTCLETVGLELEREIGADECPSGVTRVAAVRCVLDIRQRRCGEDVQKLSTRRRPASEAPERGASQSMRSLQPPSCDRTRLCSALAR